MDGYLVVIRHSCDDIPLLLTGSLAEAMQFASQVDEDDGEDEKAFLGIDATTPVCVSVMHFVGGRVAKIECGKCFDDECGKVSDA